MKTVKVKLVSSSPMLMNKRPLPSGEEEIKKKNDVIPEPKEDALSKAHFDQKIGFYIPSDMIEAAVREAGKNIKLKGQKTLKKTIQASLFVSQDKIPLGRNDYDAIDQRWVTLNGGSSILGNRIRFDKWAAEFEMNFEEDRISSKQIYAALEEAGKAIGVGSYRPKFGRFKVESFEEVD